MAFLTGTPSRFEKIGKYGPEQTAGFDLLRQLGMSGLQQGPADFGPIAERETKRFHEETIPSIAQRFSTMGGQGSSAFQESMQRGATDLSTNLAALGSQHGLQQQSQLMQMLGMGLQPQQEIGYFGGTQGAASPILGGIGRAIPKVAGAAAGAYFGGPAGAAAGGAAGDALGEGADSFIKWLMNLFGGDQQQQGGGNGSVTYNQPGF